MNRFIHCLADSFATVQKLVLRLQQRDGMVKKLSNTRASAWAKPAGIEKLIRALVQCAKANTENQEVKQRDLELSNSDGSSLKKFELGFETPQYKCRLNDSVDSPPQFESDQYAPKVEYSVPATRTQQSTNVSLGEANLKVEYVSEALNTIEPRPEQQEKTSKRRCRKRRGKFSLHKRKVERGPYKSYTAQTKRLAIDLLHEGNSAAEVGKELNIPTKNIKRWKEYGIKRRAGAGRKRIDPEMEEKLYSWLRQNYRDGDLVDMDVMRQQALLLSTKPEFMASKGWFAKFARRFEVREFYTLI